MRGPILERLQTDAWLRRLVVVGFFLVVAGGLSLWNSEDSRSAANSLGDAITVHVSKELIEKTNDLEITQQQAVDQLQVVQDQLAAQQAETKKLASEIEVLNEKLNTFQQSVSNVPAAPTVGTGTGAAPPKATPKNHN